MKHPQHKHLMIRGTVIDPPRATEDAIQWLRHFIDFLGMKVLQGPFSSYVNEDGNKGITAVAMIETSHIAFHIWDETSPALLQLDVYTCGELEVEKTLEEIEKYFNFTEYQMLVWDRADKFELLGQKHRKFS